MKAIGYQRCLPIQHEEALLLVDVPKPSPGPHDLLVKVHAVAVNPVDSKLRTRVAPGPGETKILGFDAAGVVESVGSSVSNFQPGDQVYYAGVNDRPGSNAEWQVVDERIVAKKPKALSMLQAAALPLTTITAWELLFTRLSVSRDQEGVLLVLGGAGGVGSMLIQIARQLTRLTVVATASRVETRSWCSALGAHHVVDHKLGLTKAVRALGMQHVPLIACLTATDQHWADVTELIAPQGKVGIIDDPKQLDVMPLKRKSASLHWEFMFTRPLFQTVDMAEQAAILAHAAQLVDSGQLRSTERELLGPLSVENLRKAHEQIESGQTFGKLVLSGF